MSEQLFLDLEGDNVIDLFPDVRLESWFPVEPLRPFLRCAALVATETTQPYDVGRKALARRLAARIGGSVEARTRMLDRIASGEGRFLSWRVADELACGIGLHPILIWPDRWGRPTTRKFGQKVS